MPALMKGPQHPEDFDFGIVISQPGAEDFGFKDLQATHHECGGGRIFADLSDPHSRAIEFADTRRAFPRIINLAPAVTFVRRTASRCRH